MAMELTDVLDELLAAHPLIDQVDAIADVLRRRAAAIMEAEDADVGDPTEADAETINQVADILEDLGDELEG
jgi:acyl-CoA reductase-like NAD-dependent aldehyde dehydrogenase